MQAVKTKFTRTVNSLGISIHAVRCSSDIELIAICFVQTISLKNLMHDLLRKLRSSKRSIFHMIERIYN